MKSTSLIKSATNNLVFATELVKNGGGKRVGSFILKRQNLHFTALEGNVGSRNGGIL